jgi:hypothetical protein
VELGWNLGGTRGFCDLQKIKPFVINNFCGGTLGGRPLRKMWWNSSTLITPWFYKFFINNICTGGIFHRCSTGGSGGTSLSL